MKTVKSFRDIKDQAHVTHQLRQDILTRRLKHAYLLVGPAGIGKATVAKAFAKTLFCQNPQTGDACQVCHHCLLMDHENYPNFHYLRPEDNKDYKIEDVRGLQESLHFKNLPDDYQVVVIDEAHRLGRICGNALLKSIEEPPPRTIFLLLASSTDLLLETIVSRCQTMALSLLTPKTVEQLLVEEINLDELRANAVANMAEGSMQALNYLDDLDEMLPWLDFFKLLKTIKKKPQSCWKMAESLEKQKRLMALLGYWRNVLRDALMMELAPEISMLTRQMPPLDLDIFAIEIIDIIGNAMVDIGSKANKRLTLDVMFQGIRLSINKEGRRLYG